MKTIGLCMIVKNEAHVIQRCLQSVLPLIDYCLIVDTGSSDATPSIIEQFLHAQQLAGEVISEPWQDFAYNRSAALAKLRERSDIDYALMIDADEILVFDPGFDAEAFKAQLSAAVYDVPTHYGQMVYTRPQLCSNRLPFVYKGVLHEYLDCSEPFSRGQVSGFYNCPLQDSARATNPHKYQDDAAVLVQALATETDPYLITRYTFYLAQSYRDAEQWQKSLEAYQKRATLGGWEEEVWQALYECANLSDRLALPWATVLERYLAAYQYRPQRAEALVKLAQYCRRHNQNALALLFAKQAISIPRPADVLFVDVAIYDWQALDEYAIACYWTEDYGQCEKICRDLLFNPALPASEQPRVLDNLNWALRQQGLSAEQLGSVCANTPNHSACPICQTPAAGRYLDSPYWQCPSCDTWFQDPLPEKVFHGEHEPPPAEMPASEREVNQALARWLFSHVLHSSPGPVMDIGAKLPVMAQELQRLGCRALAMDGAPDAEPLGMALDVTLIGADFETWNAADYQGRFKLITLIHTFEHFYDPVQALLKLRSMLAYNGALFIRLPDHSVAGFERDLTPGHYTIHPYFHSLQSIQCILAAAGNPFTLAETYPLAPGQRDIILRPAYQASTRQFASPSTAQELRPIIGLCRPGAIGDILMTLNFIPLLKRQHPNHAIYYFCHPAYAQTETLGSLFKAAGVDCVLPADQFENWQSRLSHAVNLIGYPLAEGYPDKPMHKHLLAYFADELKLVIGSSLPALTLQQPPKPADAPSTAYATLQMTAGWSKYKEWPQQRWQEVVAALPFSVITIGEEYGRSLAHSIALVAHARLHIGIDSFANHLTHYLWQDETGQSKRVPGVIIFGSTQANASGYSHNTNLSTNLACQPCFREDPALSATPRSPCINPPRADYNDNTLPLCLASIDTASVITAIENAWRLA